MQCRCNRVRDGERCYLTANSKIMAGGRVIKLNVADLSWAGLRWARWARWLPCNRLSIVQTLKESSHPALTQKALKLEATSITRFAQICAMTTIVYLVFTLTALWLGGGGTSCWLEATISVPLACRVGTAQEPASGACSSPFFEKLWNALRSGR